jgi:hypothetical protein
MKSNPVTHSPYLSALLEIGILFLPAISAYLRACPNLEGLSLEIFQVIPYLYILAGTLIIGLRRSGWTIKCHIYRLRSAKSCINLFCQGFRIVCSYQIL